MQRGTVNLAVFLHGLEARATEFRTVPLFLRQFAFLRLPKLRSGIGRPPEGGTANGGRPWAIGAGRGILTVYCRQAGTPQFGWALVAGGLGSKEIADHEMSLLPAGQRPRDRLAG